MLAHIARALPREADCELVHLIAADVRGAGVQPRDPPIGLALPVRATNGRGQQLGVRHRTMWVVVYPMTTNHPLAGL